MRGMTAVAPSIALVSISCHHFVNEQLSGKDVLRTRDDVRVMLEEQGYLLRLCPHHADAWVSNYHCGRRAGMRS